MESSLVAVDVPVSDGVEVLDSVDDGSLDVGSDWEVASAVPVELDEEGLDVSTGTVSDESGLDGSGAVTEADSVGGVVLGGSLSPLQLATATMPHDPTIRERARIRLILVGLGEPKVKVWA